MYVFIAFSRSFCGDPSTEAFISMLDSAWFGNIWYSSEVLARRSKAQSRRVANCCKDQLSIRDESRTTTFYYSYAPIRIWDLRLSRTGDPCNVDKTHQCVLQFACWNVNPSFSRVPRTFSDHPARSQSHNCPPPRNRHYGNASLVTQDVEGNNL